ncbi:MAG: protein translocase subunit SecF [Patescibacteria group bacterium]
MFDFLKYKKRYLLISSMVILAGLFSVLKWGFNYSIDFVGGTNLEYQLDKNVNKSNIETVFKNNKVDIESLSVANNVLSVRTKAIDETKENKIRTEIEKDLKTKVTVLRSETVGPTLGKETLIKTLYASLFAVLGILLYIAFSFKSFNFAVAAIIALLHDLFVLVGSYSLLSHFFGAQLDTLFVTAVLTTMSFSVHDTIIIFDKVREYRSSEGIANIEHSVNKALTETLVRSLNNSMTIIFMLLALTLLGGSTIRFFVAALLIGTFTGAYSSPFVAAPVLVWLEKMRKRK